MSNGPSKNEVSQHRHPIAIITLVTFAICVVDAMMTAKADEKIAVDLELVIALDVSTSMDRQERLLQRDGFVAAFRDSEVVQAIQSGPKRRIAVTVMEWAGDTRQNVMMPWTLIEDTTSAAAFADQLAQRIPGRLPMGTAVGSALRRASSMFGNDVYDSARKVIDLSGDGINNAGPEPATVRNGLVARGITINGLPIVYNRMLEGVIDSSEADLPPGYLIAYFHREIIGGPGAFVEPVTSIEEFDEAILRKLAREIRAPQDIATRATNPRSQAAVAARPGSTDADATMAVLMAATTWPIAARSSAEGPPR